jgi:CNT family concentrative nucleoside transporter
LPPLEAALAALNDLVLVLQNATEAGTSFVFGYLGGGPLPFEETQPGASFVLAFRALPLIIVISALTAVLTYWRVLPWIVRGFARALEKFLGVGGAVGLGTAANVFVGMVEAPLFIRPYLAALSRSELFIIMVSGMATIAGTVLVLYATILAPVIPNAVGNLLTASLISAPAAITVALLMIPQPTASTAGALTPDRGAISTMDAITRGTRSGLELFLIVIAMLLVLVSLVFLVNALLALLPDFGGQPVSLERLLGYLMAPVCWLMGVPWSEAVTAGSLMGIKTVLNEFLAYLRLAALPDGALSDRSALIMTYALCGFANFGSLGILIGGLSTMIPERSDEVVALGVRSIVAGTLATCCTGAVVGILSP